jgi:alkanesulfonate monooxygenase SsuD/methylene tetrahydromethanopterin reductase-like flavin-dependent oxidoreductase (luciferase family)
MTSVLEQMRKIFDGEPVGPRGMKTWPSLVGGPPILIGAYASGIWVKRAARKYDGWIASAGRTDTKTLEEAIKRFRDAGGKRAVVCSVFFDLTGPRVPLGPDTPFQIQCGPEEAAERLAWLSEIGYDDVILPKRQQGWAYYEPDITAEELSVLRGLVPKDPRPKPWELRLNPRAESPSP